MRWRLMIDLSSCKNMYNAKSHDLNYYIHYQNSLYGSYLIHKTYGVYAYVVYTSILSHNVSELCFCKLKHLHICWTQLTLRTEFSTNLHTKTFIFYVLIKFPRLQLKLHYLSTYVSFLFFFSQLCTCVDFLKNN